MGMSDTDIRDETGKKIPIEAYGIYCRLDKSNSWCLGGDMKSPFHILTDDRFDDTSESWKTTYILLTRVGKLWLTLQTMLCSLSTGRRDQANELRIALFCASM